jgi:hypothetical protein
MEMKANDRLGFSLAEYRRRYDAVRETGCEAFTTLPRQLLMK